MKRVVKLADVARDAGVSQGTASNVFNRPALVRPEVRKRVEDSALRLGYGGPDPRGRLLRAGKVNAIGIVMSDDLSYFFRDPFARLLLAGIAEVCDEHGAGLALVSGAHQVSAAWTIESALVDGFLVHCLEDSDRLIDVVRKRDLPFVSIDLDSGPRSSSVLVDDRGGARLAANHLLELGHREFAILTFNVLADADHGWIDARRLRSCTCKVERDRLAGYADALAERGLDLDRVPVMMVPNQRPAAAAYAERILAEKPATTAILAMSDVMALAAVDAAQRRGLRVPEDLSVVGFDDVPDAAAADPPLTTVAQPIAEKGRRAAQLIFAAGEPHRDVLDVELVVRKSTAPPRA